jgi:hypothetical protein
MYFYIVPAALLANVHRAAVNPRQDVTAKHLGGRALGGGAAFFQ